jgi:hypothetical protein
VVRRHTFLDSFNHPVFFNTTYFTKKHEHLAVRILLVAEQMVDKGGAWVSITANSNTFVSTIGNKPRTSKLGEIQSLSFIDARENIVQLIRHTARLGDVANRASTV